MDITGNWSLEMNAFFSHSEEDHEIVMKVNSDKARLLSPVIIYIIILMIIGIVGNPLAIYIYGWKWQDTSTRIFLLYLAEIDFINCIVTMPTEIYVILNFYYFPQALFCSTSRFFTYTYNNATSVIFLVIAFDRYIRICHPHRRSLGVTGSKIACFISLCVGISVSWPALVLYGNKYVSLQYKNVFNDTIKGVMCDVRNNMDKTPYPLLYFVYLWCGFASSLCILTVLYTCIGRVILKRKRKRTMKAGMIQTLNTDVGTEITRVKNREVLEPGTINPNMEGGNLTSKKQKKVNIRMKTVEHDDNFDISTPQLRKKNSPVSCSASTWKPHSKLRGPGSTLMLFAITAMFVLTFLPFLIIMTVRQHSGPGFYPSLSPSQQVLANLFSRSYLVNNCANPIVYGLCNSQFRQEVCKLFRRDTKQRPDNLSNVETWQDQCSVTC